MTDPQAPSPQISATNSQGTGLSEKRTLVIIDDEKDILDIVVDRLKPYFNCVPILAANRGESNGETSFATRAELKAILEKAKPTAVLTDRTFLKNPGTLFSPPIDNELQSGGDVFRFVNDTLKIPCFIHSGGYETGKINEGKIAKFEKAQIVADYLKEQIAACAQGQSRGG